MADINRFMTPAKMPQIGGFFQLPFETMAQAIQGAQQANDAIKQGLYNFANTEFNYIPVASEEAFAQEVYGDLDSGLQKAMSKVKGSDLRGLSSDVLNLQSGLNKRMRPGGDIYAMQTKYNNYVDWNNKQLEKEAELAPGYKQHAEQAILSAFDQAGGTKANANLFLPDLAKFPDVPEKIMKYVKDLPADVLKTASTTLSSPRFGYMTDREKTLTLLSIPEVKSHVLGMLSNDPEVNNWLTQSQQFNYRGNLMTSDPNINPYPLILGKQEWVNPVTNEKHLINIENPYNPFINAINAASDYAYTQYGDVSKTREDAFQIAQWKKVQEEQPAAGFVTSQGLFANEDVNPNNTRTIIGQELKTATGAKKLLLQQKLENVLAADFSYLSNNFSPTYKQTLAEFNNQLLKSKKGGIQNFNPDNITPDQYYTLLGLQAEQTLGETGNKKIDYMVDASGKRIKTKDLGKMIFAGYGGSTDGYLGMMKSLGYETAATTFGRDVIRPFIRNDASNPKNAMTKAMPLLGGVDQNKGLYAEGIQSDYFDYLSGKKQSNLSQVFGVVVPAVKGTERIKSVEKQLIANQGQGLTVNETGESVQKWLYDNNMEITAIQWGQIPDANGMLRSVPIATVINKKTKESGPLVLSTQNMNNLIDYQLDAQIQQIVSGSLGQNNSLASGITANFNQNLSNQAELNKLGQAYIGNKLSIVVPSIYEKQSEIKPGESKILNINGDGLSISVGIERSADGKTFEVSYYKPNGQLFMIKTSDQGKTDLSTNLQTAFGFESLTNK